jgi:hypothetical protein
MEFLCPTAVFAPAATAETFPRSGKHIKAGWQQMVLSDRNDRARLRPFAFARVDGERTSSPPRAVEDLAGNCIAMEVDFRTIARIDEAIALLGNETANPAMAGTS